MSYHLGSVDPDERAGLRAAAEGEAPPPRRNLAGALVAVAVMAVFAGGLWFAYHQGRHAGTGGETPLLRAEPGPTKVKPDNPGGMQIPDRHMLIYRDERPNVERLLPPPEAPLPRPAPPQSPAQPAPAAAATTPAPAAATATAPAAPAPPQPVAAPPTAPPASAAPAAAGTRLQFGALRSEAAAAQEWQRIKRANPDLVGNIETGVERADLGAKGVFWRIETRPIADPIAALQLCEALKRRNIGCVIAQ